MASSSSLPLLSWVSLENAASQGKEERSEQSCLCWISQNTHLGERRQSESEGRSSRTFERRETINQSVSIFVLFDPRATTAIVTPTHRMSSSSSSASSSSSSSSTTDTTKLLVNERQRGNPILSHIKNVGWEFTKEIVPDFVLGYTGVVFLSIRYHLLKPNYIDLRLRELGQTFRVRVLLVHIDDDNNLKALHEINKICFIREMTMIVCWSNQEGARYLETMKLYENKGSTSIQEKVETEVVPQLNKVLTTVRSVNKTDVMTLLNSFGTLAGICDADEDKLVLCPGLGDKKSKRLYEALHAPFHTTKQPSTRNIASGSRQSSSSSSSSSRTYPSVPVAVRGGYSEAMLVSTEGVGTGSGGYQMMTSTLSSSIGTSASLIGTTGPTVDKRVKRQITPVVASTLPPPPPPP